ncbi:MAG: hypothetical protein V9E94_04120 [Microthrixaceae bacterium]
MIRVGERTGELSDQLENVGRVLRGGAGLRGRQADAVVRAADHPDHRRGRRLRGAWPWCRAMYGIYNQVDF